MPVRAVVFLFSPANRFCVTIPHISATKSRILQARGGRLRLPWEASPRVLPAVVGLNVWPESSLYAFVPSFP